MLQNKDITVAIGQATWRVSIEDSHSSNCVLMGTCLVDVRGVVSMKFVYPMS